MSNAIAVIAQNTGATQEEVTDILKNMIISAKQQHGAQATNAELAVVAGVCSTYKLNPLVREAHAFISGGKLSVTIGIDGWIKIMNRQENFDGVEFEDKFDGDGKMIAVTTKIYTKNRSHPTCVTEYMDECYQENSTAWKKFKKRMLRNKSLGQCVRVAFGISEVIDDDEQSRIEASAPREKDITPTKQIDWASIQADMAECGDEASLNAVCIELRSRLEADGQWAQAKATCILMKSEHQARIQSYAAQADAAQSDVLEGEFEPASDSADAKTSVRQVAVEMEFE